MRLTKVKKQRKRIAGGLTYQGQVKSFSEEEPLGLRPRMSQKQCVADAYLSCITLVLVRPPQFPLENSSLAVLSPSRWAGPSLALSTLSLGTQCTPPPGYSDCFRRGQMPQ